MKRLVLAAIAASLAITSMPAHADDNKTVAIVGGVAFLAGAILGAIIGRNHDDLMVQAPDCRLYFINRKTHELRFRSDATPVQGCSSGKVGNLNDGYGYPNGYSGQYYRDGSNLGGCAPDASGHGYCGGGASVPQYSASNSSPNYRVAPPRQQHPF